MQRLKNVLAAFLLEAPEQVAGIIQHDARIAALYVQLGQEIGHAPEAAGKGFGDVVLALAGMLKHVLQMTDQFSQGPCRDRRLMHLHGIDKDRADRFQSQRRSAWNHRLQVLHKTRISASRPAIGGRSSWLIREGLQGLRLSLEHREDQLIHFLGSTMGPAMGISAGQRPIPLLSICPDYGEPDKGWERGFLTSTLPSLDRACASYSIFAFSLGPHIT